jgi:hypothetical protein
VRILQIKHRTAAEPLFHLEESAPPILAIIDDLEKRKVHEIPETPGK